MSRRKIAGARHASVVTSSAALETNARIRKDIDVRLVQLSHRCETKTILHGKNKAWRLHRGKDRKKRFIPLDKFEIFEARHHVSFLLQPRSYVFQLLLLQLCS